MSNSVDIVHAFWDEVWNAHDPAAADRFVADDFVIVTGGETVTGRENFKRRHCTRSAAHRDDGDGGMGSGEDGKLLSNHVERAALEQLQRLSPST
jgi:hypothetical protein